MATNCARGRTGRIEENGVELFLRLEGERIGHDRLRLETGWFEIVAEALKPVGGIIHGSDVRTGGTKLERLAAGGPRTGQESFCRQLTQETRLNGARRILHPPGTIGISSQSFNGAWAFFNRTLPVGKISPPRRSAHVEASLGTVRSSGGSIMCAAAIVSAVSWP